MPFIKVDKGLEDEADGVQLMKPMPDLDALLDRAARLGMFGTKERSVIKRANPTGSPPSSRSSSRSPSRCSATGLMPIIEPEVSIKSPSGPLPTRILLDES